MVLVIAFRLLTLLFLGAIISIDCALDIGLDIEGVVKKDLGMS